MSGREPRPMIALSEDDPTFVAIKQIARQYRMSIKDVVALLNAAVSAEIDPMDVSEIGEPFVFKSERPKTPMIISTLIFTI